MSSFRDSFEVNFCPILKQIRPWGNSYNKLNADGFFARIQQEMAVWRFDVQRRHHGWSNETSMRPLNSNGRHSAIVHDQSLYILINDSFAHPHKLMTIFGWTATRFFFVSLWTWFSPNYIRMSPCFDTKVQRTERGLMCCLLLKSGQNCHFSTLVCKYFPGSMPPDPLGWLEGEQVVNGHHCFGNPFSPDPATPLKSRTFSELMFHISRTRIEAAAWKKRPGVNNIRLNPTAFRMPNVC